MRAQDKALLRAVGKKGKDGASGNRFVDAFHSGPVQQGTQMAADMAKNMCVHATPHKLWWKKKK